MILCDHRTADQINALFERYAKDAGYRDKEPLRTIKFRRMQVRIRIAALKRARPLPLP